MREELPFDFAPLPGAEGEAGWRSWNLVDETRFNSVVLGPMQVRREGDQCRLRMFPERKHTNLQDAIHGATTLGLIDVALFATMHTLGDGDAGPSVTLELSTQFVGAGDPSQPLDVVGEIVRETGGLAFLRGQAVQGEQTVASYSGIIRKMKNRQ